MALFYYGRNLGEICVFFFLASIIQNGPVPVWIHNGPLRPGLWLQLQGRVRVPGTQGETRVGGKLSGHALASRATATKLPGTKLSTNGTLLPAATAVPASAFEAPAA